MNHDDYYAGAPNPAPSTVVDAVNEGLAKRKPQRDRSFDRDSRPVRWLAWLSDIFCWWT